MGLFFFFRQFTKKAGVAAANAPSPKVLRKSRRFFIIPIQNAEKLADALYQAIDGVESPKPDWLPAREAVEDEQLEKMAELGIEEETIGEAKDQLERERRGRI